MTPAEQIAYLRKFAAFTAQSGAVLAVCDLAERALLLEEAARDFLGVLPQASRHDEVLAMVAPLRRLLGDGSDEDGYPWGEFE
jgi:hypothetical protein